MNVDGKTVKAPLDNVGWQFYQGQNTLVCVKPTIWKESFVSDESKERLQGLFEDTNNEQLIRKYAFKLWETSISENDIAICQRILPTDICYPISIWRRARRRDITVIDELIDKIMEDPLYWWQCARYIWDKKLELLLEEKVSNITTDSDENFLWIIGGLFEKLSKNKAEHLLITNWQNLSKNPVFIGIALKIATDKLKRLIAQTIELEPDKSTIFEIAKNTICDSYSNIDFIHSYQQLEALKDYLQYFDEFFLEKFCRMCLKNNWREFLAEYLVPRLTKESYLQYTRISTYDLDTALTDQRTSFVYYWFTKQTELGWDHSEVVNALLD